MQKLENCCQQLASKKITERRSICNGLLGCLKDPDVIDELNGGSITWNKLVASIQNCMTIEAPKIVEKKRKSGSATGSAIANCGDLYYQVIYKALTKGCNFRISEEIANIVNAWQEHNLRVAFESVYLKTLVTILSHSPDLAELGTDNWQDLFDMLKVVPLLLSKIDALHCFMLTIKWGPLFGLSIGKLRSQFEFITNLVGSSDNLSVALYKQYIVDVAIEFCRHTCYDNRVACCKFGEDTIDVLLQLYDHSATNKVADKILEFFLLQVQIHNPDETASYAYNADSWISALKSIHSLLMSDLKHSKFKNKINISVPFDKLFVNLFVQVSRQLFLINMDGLTISYSISEGSHKRQRLEITLPDYIHNIQDTKDSNWIIFVGSIIEGYPELLDEHNYINLLQILLPIQVKSNETLTLVSIYKCFSAMLDLEGNYKLKPTAKTQIDGLWKMVAESIIRSIDESELLLQKLITHRKIADLEPHFRASLVNISQANIQTLHVILKANQNTLKCKKNITVCVLKSDTTHGYDHFLHPSTAAFFCSLLRQNYSNDAEVTKNHRKISSELAQIYATINYEKLVVDGAEFPSEDKSNLKTLVIDVEFETFFQNFLHEFVADNFTLSNIAVLSMLVFLVNYAECLIKYKVITVDNKNHFVINLIQQILAHIDVADELKLDSKEKCANLKKYLHIFSAIFAVDDSILTKEIRDFVSSVLLKNVYDNLVDKFNSPEWQENEIDSGFMLKQLTVEVLLNFACVSGSHPMSENQSFLLTRLAQTNKYDYYKDADCILLFQLFKKIKHCHIGYFPDEILQLIISCVQSIYEIRYNSYNFILDILEVLYDLYPHLFASNLDKSVLINFLNPLIIRHLNYGPKVTVAILKCIRQLCKLDPEFNYICWHSGEDVIDSVPAFLISEHVEVRFEAIRTLITFFKYYCVNVNVEVFYKQQSILKGINDMCLFELPTGSTDVQKIDANLTRTSTVLHFYGSVIVNCNIWIEESLYALFNVVHRKKLKFFQKMLNLINQHYAIKNETEFIDNYLEHILENWITADNNYKIDDFPFDLYNCETKEAFYRKYFDNHKCVALAFAHDQEVLLKVAESLELSLKDLLKIICPQLFVQALRSEKDNLFTSAILRNEFLLSVIKSTSVDQLKSILLDNLDQVILALINLLTDDNDIRDKFQITVWFTTTNLKLPQYHNCLEFIEAFLIEGNNAIEHLSKNSLNVLEKIMLTLLKKVYKSSVTDQKLKSFYLYSVFSDMVLAKLKPKDVWKSFFIRQSTYFLINLIQNHLNDSTILQVFCKYLNKFLRNILPAFASTLESFFVFVVNSLKNLAMAQPSIAEQCIDMLEFIIVENASDLQQAIEKLHVFPDLEIFANIRRVFVRSACSSLEEEIVHFLENESSMDSLRHLKVVLAREKGQLKLMYDKLSDLRGFSEDCKESLLHRLVSMLVKMSTSVDRDVSFEAIACLGELGPANLMSLVLEPEKEITNLKLKPLTLLSGHLVSLLCTYIVDSDIQVVEAASKALYAVLSSKEGTQVAGNATDFGYGVLNKSYILPFLPTTKQTLKTSLKLDVNLFTSKMDLYNLWVPETEIPYEQWIKSLVIALLGVFDPSTYLSHLVQICGVKASLCKELLPLLIYLIIFQNDVDVTNIISKQINHFFAKHWTLTVPDLKPYNSIAVNKKAVRCMLDVVNFVRLQLSFLLPKKIIFELDYLKIAQAAEFSAAHFTALFYAELWCRGKIDQGCDANGKSFLDAIYEREAEEVGETLHNLLRNAYKSIGDEDALHGCGMAFMLKPKYRIERYKDLGQWDQLSLYYDMQCNSSPTVDSGLMDSLMKCGLYNSSLKFARNSNTEAEYESMWRLSQWDFKENRTQNEQPRNFSKFQYQAMKSLHLNDKYHFNEAKNAATLCLVDKLKHISLESSANFYAILSQIQGLNELSDFANAADFKDLFAKWMAQKQIISNNHFQYIEPIISQRIVIVKDHLSKNPDDEPLKENLVEMILDFSDLARFEGQYHVASHCLKTLQDLTDLSDDILNKIQYQEAQLRWSRNEKVLAQYILSKLCAIDEPLIRSDALKLAGQWKVETQSENSVTIINEYFMKALRIDKDLMEKNNASTVKTLLQLASFADKQYQQKMELMKSDSYQLKIQNMRESKATAAKFNRLYSPTPDQKKAAHNHLKQSKIDEEEIRFTEKEKDDFLMIALQYYFLYIQHSDDDDIRIFRAMKLFLENRNNSAINDLIESYLPKIPSYKYITMLPQLIPHISDDNPDTFNKHIGIIIKKCAIEHPHHTLPLLVSLINANRDRVYGSSKTKTSSNDVRISAANKLLALIKDSLPDTQIIEQLQKLTNALIELAYYVNPRASERRAQQHIPKECLISKIRNYDKVLVPTVNLPVRKMQNYENIIGIQSYNQTYNNVDGVNAPKRITCIGTDGKARTQLVKGHDDMRQDAVMQQVFTIMNNLLAMNKQTRNLLIRTYKIVPLSMRSGVLEWVANSMPIGEYLAGEFGTSGAHSTYRPRDMSVSEVRGLFKHNSSSTKGKERLSIFKKICSKFKPVFHKFFVECFPHPTVWYERRRAYIHSVATSSMCGYILGIGDRHVSNILIDKITAEVIHIDFGIAFEQGKLLPTPETVPFRLTRDIVDGMGVSGVEGVFRRACEKTIEVLRLNSQTIITILEVLLYDPLYAWTVSVAEANKRQTDVVERNVQLRQTDSDGNCVNITAERALLRLRTKLQGYENGNPTSIEHQVGSLIQQAVDPDNLCRLYHGWQPYL